MTEAGEGFSAALKQHLDSDLQDFIVGACVAGAAVIAYAVIMCVIGIYRRREYINLFFFNKKTKKKKH